MKRLPLLTALVILMGLVWCEHGQAAEWSMYINMYEFGLYTSSNGRQQEYAGDGNSFTVYNLLSSYDWNSSKGDFINALNSNDTDGDGFTDYSEIYWQWGNYSVVTNILENPNTPTTTKLAIMLGRYWYYDKSTASAQRWNGITLDNVDYWTLDSTVQGLINAQNQTLDVDVNGHIKMLGTTNIINNYKTLTGGVTMRGSTDASTNAFTNYGTINLAATSGQLGWIDRPGYEPRTAILAESARSMETNLDAAISLSGYQNTLSNYGTIDGGGSGVITLTGTANSLVNAGTILNASVLLTGTTTDATGTLTNHGNFSADVTMSGTVSNTVENQSGGVFVGGVNLSATGSNSFMNDAGGVYYGTATLSAAANTVKNGGEMHGNVSLTGQTNFLTNAGSLTGTVVAMTGTTSDATATLTNAGTLAADVSMSGTASNTLNNQAGGVFTGNVSLSASGSNTFTNDASLSGNVSLTGAANTITNTGTLVGASVTVSGSTTDATGTLTNSGSLRANVTMSGLSSASVNNQTSGIIKGDLNITSTGINSLTNSGKLEGNIALIGKDSALTNAGTLSGSTASLTGTTSDSTATLTNSGSLSTSVALSGTVRNEINNQSGGVFNGDVSLSSSGTNVLANAGTLSGNVELTGKDNTLTTEGTLSGATVSIKGTTLNSTATLTNSGSFGANVAISGTANNTLTNQSGGILLGDLNLVATGSNVVTNDSSSALYGSVNLTGSSNTLTNMGTLTGSTIALASTGSSSTATFTNAGTVGATTVSLDTEVNTFTAASGSTTSIDALLFQPTATGSGTNNLAIQDVGLTSGSFSAGVQFVNPSSTNTVSVTNSDATFTSPSIGWGNNASDTFTAMNSIIRAPNGLTLGGSTGGGIFTPERVVMTGDVTLQNIFLSGAFGDSAIPLLHFTDHATFDGVTILNSGGFTSPLISLRYGDKSGLITAGYLTVGSGGVWVNTGNGAQRIDTTRVSTGLTTSYVGLDYVWVVVPGTDGFVGVEAVFKDHLFESAGGTGTIGQTLDQLLYNPDTTGDLFPLFLYISSFTSQDQYRDALAQLNSQSNLTAAEIAMRLWSIDQTNDALSGRFDSWRDQLLLAEFFPCFRSGQSGRGETCPCHKGAAQPVDRADYTNVAPENNDSNACSSLNNLTASGLVQPMRVKPETFLSIYGSRTSQNAYSTFTGYDSALYGGVTGLDFCFRDVWHAGGFLDVSSATTKLQNNVGHIEDTALRFGGYSSVNMDAFYYDTILSMAYHDLNSVRELPFLGSSAKASYSGMDASWQNGIGYRFELPWNLYLTPYETVTASGLYTGEHKEKDATLNANLQYASFYAAALENAVGIKLARPWQIKDCFVIVPRLRLSYEYGSYFLDDLTSAFAVAPASTWQTPIELPSSGRVGAGLSLSTYLTPRISLSAGVNAKVWNTGVAWSGNASLGIQF